MQASYVPAFFEAAARDVYNAVHPRTQKIDSFILSYQKCGRTWLELMLARAFAEIYGLEASQISRQLPRMQQAAGRGPVIFSTHDWSETTGEDSDPVSPYLMLAYPIRLRYLGRRVLMLIRDPRDTIVSSYYQVTQRAYRPLTFSDIDAYALDPLYGFLRIIRFYQTWAFNRRLPAYFKIARYEDLKSDGPKTLAEIAAFLGLGALSEERFAAIYAASSLGEVRRMEDAGEADLFKFDGPQASKARRGIVGSHQDELRPETIQQLNRWMKRLPPSFAYPAG